MNIRNKSEIFSRNLRNTQSKEQQKLGKQQKKKENLLQGSPNKNSGEFCSSNKILIDQFVPDEDPTILIAL